jgi:hypothetical protein
MEAFRALRRSTVRVLVVLACGLILGAQGSAIGSVVPNACIARIGLWDTKARVAREWGPPTRKARDPEQQLWWYYPNGTVHFVQLGTIGWIVEQVFTTDRRERVKGIGVGSWRSEVHAATGGRCLKGFPSCEIASRTTRGRRSSTDVHFDGDRVRELSISVERLWPGVYWYPDERCRKSR